MTDAVTTRLTSEVSSSQGLEVDARTYRLNVEALSSVLTTTYALSHALAIEVLSVNDGQKARRTLFVST